jgi:LacI family transcriptional regulator
MSRNVTLADVAAKAKVSTATVSRALNGDKAVRSETRLHVTRVAREMGFVPSTGARLLVQGESAVIGLSLGRRDFETSRYVAMMHQTLSRHLVGQGWLVRLVLGSEFEDLTGRLGGFILLGVSADDPRMALCRDRDTPFVAIGMSGPDVFWVAPDDTSGAQQAIDCLAPQSQGTIDILYHDDGQLNERLQAAFDRCDALGLKARPLPAPRGPMSSLLGYRTVHAALRQGRKFTAMFAETDELALGAAAAFSDAGLEPGREVKLVGFDDLPHMAGGLTTVAQDFNLLAQHALLLLGEARNREPARSLRMPVTLVRRATA